MKKIPLTQGQFALVDDEDFEYLNRHKWYALKSGKTYYARRNVVSFGKRISILMHKAIVSAPPGKEVDHEDGNGLNNQKSNLRTCTHKENTRNRFHNNTAESGFKGVYWNPNNKRWFVSVRTIAGLKHIGYFDDKTEAARHYNLASKEHFGKYAKYNKVFPLFPDEQKKAHSIDSKSGFIGVYFDKKNNKWKSSLCYKGRRYNLGSFETAETAAIAYDELARALKGESAKVNFKLP